MRRARHALSARVHWRRDDPVAVFRLSTRRGRRVSSKTAVFGRFGAHQGRFSAARFFGFRFPSPALRLPVLSVAAAATEGCHGEVAEWSIAPDSKSGVGQPTVGSNPILSAILRLSASEGEGCPPKLQRRRARQVTSGPGFGWLGPRYPSMAFPFALGCWLGACARRSARGEWGRGVFRSPALRFSARDRRAGGNRADDEPRDAPAGGHSSAVNGRRRRSGASPSGWARFSRGGPRQMSPASIEPSLPALSGRATTRKCLTASHGKPPPVNDTNTRVLPSTKRSSDNRPIKRGREPGGVGEPAAPFSIPTQP